MNLALIAAHDPNLVIGSGGGLPWHYREDMLYFKRTTMGRPVVMGRGVFEEVGKQPLPGRRNVVLSRSRKYPDSRVEVYRSLDVGLAALEKEDKVFVIGGGQIYRQTLDKADELYITEIHKVYNGDTFFPEYRGQINSRWEEIWREDHSEFSFVRYKRKS